MQVVKRDLTMSKTQVSLKSIEKALRDSGQGFLLEYKVIPETSIELKSVSIAVEAILDDFIDVFQEP